jgi:predicted amidohydrolase YtcJ
VLLRADTILTMADDPAAARAVRVDGERIAGVHGDAGAPEPGEQVLDFGARVLMPGFIDVHAHYEVAARTGFTSVDCRVPGCATVGDVLEVLRTAAAETTTGWVVGQGNLFLDQKLAERRLPTREELDGVSDDVAIALRAGGHITVLNSRALALAGIDEHYVEPQGSVTGQPIVERHDDGRPTGVVKEMDNLLPFPPLDDVALRAALKQGAVELFSRNGVTTVGEISESLEGLRAMDELALDGELAIRVAVYLWVPGTMSLEEATSAPPAFASPPHHVGVKGMKIFADGGFSAASAAVKRPYAIDPCSHGTLAVSHEYVSDAARRASAAGLQLAIHANGERAQELVCAALTEVGADTAFPLPPRIEHAGNFLPDQGLTERWREAGIVPVPQPVFIFAIGEAMPAYVGEYGHHGQFPLRDLLDAGWSLSGSSDVWIGSEQPQTSPLFSVWCCVQRTGFSGALVEPEQAITVDEALWMHTRGGARVLGEEDEKGSIEAGKLADLIVLAEDPRAVDPGRIGDIAVDFVFLGGRCVYARPGAEAYREVVA